MKYIKKYEGFNWNKLNLFSKSKEKIDEDDDNLAKSIYSVISRNVKIVDSNIRYDGVNDWYEFNYDGDRFKSSSNLLMINNQKIHCSKETIKKFYSLFKSINKEKEEGEEGKERKENRSKLKDKYQNPINQF